MFLKYYFNMKNIKKILIYIHYFSYNNYLSCTHTKMIEDDESDSIDSTQFISSNRSKKRFAHLQGNEKKASAQSVQTNFVISLRTHKHKHSVTSRRESERNDNNTSEKDFSYLFKLVDSLDINNKDIFIKGLDELKKLSYCLSFFLYSFKTVFKINIYSFYLLFLLADISSLEKLEKMDLYSKLLPYLTSESEDITLKVLELLINLSLAVFFLISLYPTFYI